MIPSVSRRLDYIVQVIRLGRRLYIEEREFRGLRDGIRGTKLVLLLTSRWPSPRFGPLPCLRGAE